MAIGTESNILVYQVDDNLEIFYKEIPEGVRCMLIGCIDLILGPMLLVGSNTTVRGLNDKGDEIFWIVTTGNVNSMILFDFNRDSENEILLGCEDHKIKIYKNDKFLRDLNENASVKQIASIGPLLISFILQNGTIGVYEEHVRLWRIKVSKYFVRIVNGINEFLIFSQKLVQQQWNVTIYLALDKFN